MKIINLPCEVIFASEKNVSTLIGTFFEEELFNVNRFCENLLIFYQGVFIFLPIRGAKK